MIWTVTPNPAVDTTYNVGRLRYGQTHRVQQVQVRPGGKGLNVARVLEQLGARVGTTGLLGGTSGQFVCSQLTQLAPTVEQRWVDTGVKTRTSVAVVDGQATVFNESGQPVPNWCWAELEDLLRQVVHPGDVVTINGSLPQDTPAGTVPGLARAAREAGARLIIDTSGAALLESAAWADIVKPNEEELLAATGAETVSEGVAQLQARGCQVVVVSRGGDGMELWSPLGVWACRPPRVLVGNATGAGDAAVASLALTLQDADLGDAQQLRAALRQAVATSAAAVVVPTAGEIDMPVRTELLASLTVSDVA